MDVRRRLPTTQTDERGCRNPRGTFGKLNAATWFHKESYHCCQCLKTCGTYIKVTVIITCMQDWPALYDIEILRDTTVPVAAAVYAQDLCVVSTTLLCSFSPECLHIARKTRSCNIVYHHLLVYNLHYTGPLSVGTWNAASQRRPRSYWAKTVISGLPTSTSTRDFVTMVRVCLIV